MGKSFHKICVLKKKLLLNEQVLASTEHFKDIPLKQLCGIYPMFQHRISMLQKYIVLYILNCTDSELLYKIFTSLLSQVFILARVQSSNGHNLLLFYNIQYYI